MIIQLKLKSDNHNSYCGGNVLSVEFFNDGEVISSDQVFIKIDDREVSVNKEDFKKMCSII